jgi:hypothetical protein
VKWLLSQSHVLSRDLAGFDWSSSSGSSSSDTAAVAARTSSPSAIPAAAGEGPYLFFAVPQRTRDCVALLCQRMCDSITGCVDNARPAARDSTRMEIAHNIGRTIERRLNCTFTCTVQGALALLLTSSLAHSYA